MAKAEPAHVRETRRKRDQLFDHYAAIGTGSGKVAELVGCDVTEAARELSKRKGARAQAAQGGSVEGSPQ